MANISVWRLEWDWTPGQTLHEDKDWYADMPGYGDFLDPPYYIQGQIVRGGPAGPCHQCRTAFPFEQTG